METFSLFIYALNHVLRSAKVNLCVAPAHIEQQNMAASRLSKLCNTSELITQG